jgi:hypothetical protein
VEEPRGVSGGTAAVLITIIFVKKTREAPPSAEDLSAAMRVLARHRWSKKTPAERSKIITDVIKKRWAKRKSKGKK